MGNDRLNGLALLNIHREIHAASVLDKLTEKPRRLPFRMRWCSEMFSVAFAFVSSLLLLHWVDHTVFLCKTDSHIVIDSVVTYMLWNNLWLGHGQKLLKCYRKSHLASIKCKKTPWRPPLTPMGGELTALLQTWWGGGSPPLSAFQTSLVPAPVINPLSKNPGYIRAWCGKVLTDWCRMTHAL